MKYKPIVFILLTFIISFFLLPACEDDDWSVEKTNTHVNEWVYDVMSKYYYWNELLVAPSDFSQNTEKFFESLLYKRYQNGGDRFSWIQNSYVDLLNALSGVASYDLGFKYQFLQEESSNNVYAVVLYVKPDTDAVRKGLKRGMLIAEVNGTQINTDNYLGVFPSGMDNYKLGILSEGERLKYIDIKPQLNYAENPVFLDTIYTYNSQKTGYVVYNFFSSDKGDNSYTYDKQLADVFNRFLQSGAKNIILDLRYNSGGSVESSKYLASALVPERQENKVYFRYEYNKTYSQTLKGHELYNYFSDKINQSYDIPHLGDKIDNLYILTGKGSASASELVINGLKPFMGDKLILIGNVTYGKNMASATFYKKNDKHNRWGLQPIIARLSNTNGSSDYESGFQPDYLLNEYNHYMYELGDRQELLLNKALAIISGEGTSFTPRKSSSIKAGKILQSSDQHYNMYLNSINTDL